MKIKSQAILLILLLFLFGCGNKVRVVDMTGAPIKNAKVTPASLSMNGQTVLTNASGYASVPSSIGGQEVKWVNVECVGYQTPTLPPDAKFPLVITLQKP